MRPTCSWTWTTCVPVSVSTENWRRPSPGGCVLAVIGPRWHDLLAEQASGECDYVREEIAGALQRGILVIPVLIERRPAPRANALPENIRDLALHQAHEVAHARFGRDVAELVDVIQSGRAEEDRSQAEAYRRSGDSQVENCDNDLAIADYTRAIEIDPKHAVAYYSRGACHHEKRDYDRAIADYTKAIDRGRDRSGGDRPPGDRRVQPPDARQRRALRRPSGDRAARDATATQPVGAT